jgi:hypothetical protein
MERRNHPRVEVSHPVLCFTDIYGRPKGGSTLDLSLGGTRIEMLYGLVTGERVEVTIAIRPQAITCRGKAVYVMGSNGGRMQAGIKFEELSEYDRLYLQEYLSQVMEERA